MPADRRPSSRDRAEREGMRVTGAIHARNCRANQAQRETARFVSTSASIAFVLRLIPYENLINLITDPLLLKRLSMHVAPWRACVPCSLDFTAVFCRVRFLLENANLCLVRA